MPVLSKTLSLFLLTCCFLARAQHSEELAYYEKGDLIVAMLMSIVEGPTYSDRLCGQKMSQVSKFMDSEALVYAVRQVNQKNVKLLHGLKLGLVVLDDCHNPSLTIMQSQRFIPVSESCRRLKMGPIHNVIGVIGLLSAGRISKASLTLSPFQIPILSYSPTSSLLNNEILYTNLFRLVPATSYQAHVMIRFLLFRGWKQVSIVFSHSWIDQEVYAHLLQNAKTFNVCIDGVKLVDEATATKFQYEHLVTTLVQSYKSRIVLVSAGLRTCQGLMEAADQLNVTGQIIWIGLNEWAEVFLPSRQLTHLAPGFFVFSMKNIIVSEFEDSVQAMSPKKTKNPWLLKAFQEMYNCTMPACNQNMKDLPQMSITGHKYDTVLTFAHALNALIKNNCSSAWGRKAKTCVIKNRQYVIDYVQKVSFLGETGRVSFNELGNRLTSYFIYQAVADSGSRQLTPRLVAEYNIERRRFIEVKEPSWASFQEKKFVQPTCTVSCMPGSLKIRFKCCWVCKPCKVNEIIAVNTQRCLPCPEFEWPSDIDNRTYCVPIKHKYLTLDSPSVKGLLVLTAIGISLSMFILGIYMGRREQLMTKSSSWGLGVIQQVSILVNYCAGTMLLQKPTDHGCDFAFALINISFNSLYAATLLKAIQVYRIFEAGEGYHKIMFTGELSQITAMAICISVEIALWLHVYKRISPIKAFLNQPDKMKPIVNLSCEISTLKMMVFLASNLIILVLCSTFAFMTRGLANQFNENRHVTYCVITTIITWLIFLCTFSASQNIHADILSFCSVIIITQILATICLFVPRLWPVLERRSKTVGRSFLIAMHKS